MNTIQEAKTKWVGTLVILVIGILLLVFSSYQETDSKMGKAAKSAVEIVEKAEDETEEASRTAGEAVEKTVKKGGESYQKSR